MLAVGLAAGLSVAFAPAAVAQNDSVEECTSNGGVWVVVANEDWTRAGCATNPTSGEDALKQAGFDVQYDGSGFLCQISGFPAECPKTPAMDAYWSYWQAEPEGEAFTAWHYATTGPIDSRPAAGTLEGWWFSDGSETPQLPTYLPGGATAAPGAPASASGSHEPIPSASASATADVPEPTPAPAPAQSSGMIGWIILGAALMVGAIALVGTRWQRSRR